MRFLFLMFLLVLFISACAPKQDAVRRFFWPPPPDTPKIEYIGVLQSDWDVRKLDVGSLEETIFGREKPKPMFERPFDVVSDSKGRIIVSEPILHTVKQIDLNAAEMMFAKGADGEAYNFKLPLGLSLDREGNVYVVDSIDKKIIILDRQLTVVNNWRGGHFSRPANLAIDEVNGRVYVVEPDQHKVLVLAKDDGRLIGSFGERGGEDGQFNFPLDVDTDSEGNVYVLDSLNARVQVFDPEGEFLRKFGERGTALGSFRLPKGLSVGADDLVFVTDSLAHRVVIFDKIGNYLLTIGGRASISEQGLLPGGFYMPQGLDVDVGGQVWVVDALNGLVSRFQYLNDAYLESHPILPGQAVDPFN